MLRSGERTEINRAEAATHILVASMQCRLFIVFRSRLFIVFRNCVRWEMLLELISLPIHLFQYLLVDQFGLASALAESRPGMFPKQSHQSILSVTPPTCGPYMAQLASLFTTVVLPIQQQRNSRVCL
jgi:hypothetical protein